MKKNMKMVYAINDGDIKHISEVISGLKCNCICPFCSEELIAKKGNKMAHHFSHVSNSDCEFGYETSLHLGAKEILSKIGKFKVPSIFLEFPDINREKMLIHEGEELYIYSIDIEKKLSDIIPDLLLHTNTGDILVEIYVTHKVDEEKLEKVKNINLPILEINLSKMSNSITQDELEEILYSDNSSKKWLYHPLINTSFKNIKSYSDNLSIVSRGYATHVDDCPINKRITKWGKSYARFIDDCIYCNFIICVHQKNNQIACTGRTKIASPIDVELTQKERDEKYKEYYKNSIDDFLRKGICPQCHDQLVLRKGNKGFFFGCDGFPYCKFTCNAYIDEISGEVCAVL